MVLPVLKGLPMPSLPAPIAPADILIPTGVDMSKWCVLASDQYSSSTRYWNRVADYVGDAPSTLGMIVPEVYLAIDSPDQLAARVAATRRAMDEAVAQVLRPYPHSVIYVERSTSRVERRRSLVVGIDLEQYSFVPGASVDIRASEETVLERIPPREAVRSSASVELPHAQVLFDDPSNQVFDIIDAALSAGDPALKPLYDTELMLGGGAVRGWHLSGDGDLWASIKGAFDNLATGSRGFRFIVGDGNHSLAAAAAHWQKLKSAGAGGDHPARFALAELIEVHDPGLVMEPIHRLVRGLDEAVLRAEVERWNGAHPAAARARIDWITGSGVEVVAVAQPGSLAVEAVQEIIDAAISAHDLDPAHACEYVHGEGELCRLVEESGGVGILLPAIDRSGLFDYVAEFGPMPRKSFSLGEAEEKRYYLECRAII